MTILKNIQMTNTKIIILKLHRETEADYSIIHPLIKSIYKELLLAI